MSQPQSITLVLAGGDALGSYQAGAYAALHRRNIRIDRIVGASAGAINGALIAGNAVEDRIDRLRAFWRPSASGAALPWPFDRLETMRRTLAATWSVSAGRSGVFGPRADPLWQEIVGSSTPSVYATTALAATLADLIDVDRLNASDIRYCATSVDLQSGAELVFDTDRGRVGIAHIRASASLPPAFPPVEIDGRLCIDGGLSANLPVDPFLSAPGESSVCVAIDLFSLAAPRPANLGGLAERAQDLIFAAQSRRSIEGWQRTFAARAAGGDRSAVALVHLQFADQAREVSGKAFDFSPQSAALRWATGERDMDAVLDRIAAGEIALGVPGLAVTTIAPRSVQ